MLYSVKGRHPTTKLPHRIRLSNGLTKTDSTTFTDSDLASAGITTAADPPTYDINTHKLDWNSEITEWQLIELTQDELNEITNQKWVTIRTQRDKLLLSGDQRILRYQSEERAGITTHGDNISDLDTYMKQLRDIPQTYTNPNDVVWPELPWTDDD